MVLQTQASFKKAANTYVWLHAINPFRNTQLSNSVLPEDFETHANAITTLIGYALVKACLHGVEIQRSDGVTIKLVNPISLSRHFMCDLVEASGPITPAGHFKTFSLLFESLAYEANPGVCYEKVF